MGKIYTKTGDKGSTGLVGGTRVAKDDVRLNAYGEVDELNSFVGFLRASCSSVVSNEDSELLSKIQSSLFVIGSHLACEEDKVEAFKLPNLDSQIITQLESRIDAHALVLPPLKNFILPGGSKSASAAHICRTVCRRVERAMIANSNTHIVNSEFLIFINRLSDYFFSLARILNQFENTADEIWQTK